MAQDYYEGVINNIDTLHVAGGSVPYLKSFPGEGKTALMREMSQRPTVRTATGEAPIGGFTTLLLGTMDETDLAGIPLEGSVERGGKEWPTTRNATPQWAVEAARVADTGAVYYVLMDEVTRAKQDVQGAGLNVLSSHALPNGFILPPGVRFLLAGNGVEHDASAYDLIPALTNRLTHMEFSPPMSDWAKKMTTNFGQPCSASELRWRGVVAGYLASNPQAARQTANDDRKAGWVSKRSWDNVARYLGAIPEGGEINSAVVDGTIGKGQSDPFLAYVNGLVLPEPKEILADPSVLDGMVKPLLWAALNNLAVHVLYEDASEANSDKGIAVLNYAASENADIATMVLNTVVIKSIELYPGYSRKVSGLIGKNFHEVSGMIDKFAQNK